MIHNNVGEGWGKDYKRAGEQRSEQGTEFLILYINIITSTYLR